MPKFDLCHKEYDFKFSVDAIKRFDQDTGLCMWSKVIEISSCYIENKNIPIRDFFIKMGAVISFRQASYFLYRLAKSENSQLSVEEIQDAMFHSSMIPADEHCNPWQMVLVNACFDIQSELETLNASKKK